MSEELLQRLKEEILKAPLPVKEGKRPGIWIAVLVGENTPTKKLLLGQEMIIRFFPFHVGRRPDLPQFGWGDVDLALEDKPPYRISRRHLTFYREKEGISVVDERSTSGTLVDGVLLGGKNGGIHRLLLSPGRHELILGGKRSPYVFSLFIEEEEVEKRGTEVKVSLAEKTIPVEIIYNRLYQFTKMILQAFPRDPTGSVEKAASLVRFMMENSQICEPLCYYSAVPTLGDDVIANHSLNVALYTWRLSISLGLSPADSFALTMAALFHDIGMYDVPGEIVGKVDPISNQEFAAIKKHALTGEEKMRPFSNQNELLHLVAWQHHERVDGSGYPGGVKDFSPYVELVGMVDFFEAITHYRPQRGPVTPHEGIRMLVEMKDMVFRPENLKSFLKVFSLYPIYSIVRLNTGEIGQVIKTYLEVPLRPVVRILLNMFGERIREERVVDLTKNSNLYIQQDISDRVFIDHYFPLDFS